MTSVSPGVRNGTRMQVVTFTSINGPGTYVDNVVGEHNQTKASQPRSQWMRVLPYRVFASRMLLEPYSFLSTYGGPFTGTTDHRNGVSFIPTGLQYNNTRVSNFLRTPDVPVSLVAEVQVHAMRSLGESAGDLAADLVEVVQTIDLIADLMSRILSSINDLRDGRFKRAIDKLIASYDDYYSWARQSRHGANPFGVKVNQSLHRKFGRTGLFQQQNYVRGLYKLSLNRKVWYDRITQHRRSKTDISDVWLELQYGWFPLMGSIAGLCENLNNMVGGKPLLVTGYSSRVVGGNIPNPATCKVSGSSELGAECKIWARVSDPQLVNAQRIGISAGNLLTGAWEAIPFSFIIDWFLPIGNWLQAIIARQGLTFHDGYVSTRVLNDFSAVRTYDVKTIYTSAPTIRYKSVCQSRVPLGAFPVVGIYLKNPFSTTHVANALALLHSSNRNWH